MVSTILLVIVASLACTSFSATVANGMRQSLKIVSPRRGEFVSWILWMVGFFGYLLGQKHVKQGHAAQALVPLLFASGLFGVLIVFEFKRLRDSKKSS